MNANKSGQRLRLVTGSLCVSCESGILISILIIAFSVEIEVEMV